MRPRGVSHSGNPSLLCAILSQSRAAAWGTKRREEGYIPGRMRLMKMSFFVHDVFYMFLFMGC